MTFANILLRRVHISDPLLSPGVILGNATNPIRNLTLDDVSVKFGANPLHGLAPYGHGFKCEHAAVNVLGGIRLLNSLMRSPCQTFDYEFTAKLDPVGFSRNIRVTESGRIDLSDPGR